MEVIYVDASECPRKVLGPLSSSLTFIFWLYGAAMLFLVPAAVVVSDMPKGVPLPLWVMVLLTAAFASPLVLPFVALFMQDRALKWSSLRIAPYGVTLRQLQRRLNRLRRDQDRVTGWSHARISSLAWLLRLAAVCTAGAAVAYMMRNTPLNKTTGPTVLAGLVASWVLWMIANRLLRPRQAGALLWAKTTAQRLGAVLLFLAVPLASLMFFAFVASFWSKQQPPWFITLPIYIVGCLLTFAAFEKLSRVWARITALTHPSTADARRWDKRAPALLLRSFPDDAHSVEHEMASKWEDVSSVSLEDAVHDRIARYGPYIAVAEPNIGVTGGAARDRFTGEEWRAAVQGWMDEALIVTLMAGWTQGVQWELDQTIARGHVEKLLIVLPGGPNIDTRWRQACRSFSGTAWHSAMLSVDTRFALAVHCTRGRVVVVASRARSARHYSAAVELAIYGMFCAGTRSHGPT